MNPQPLPEEVRKRYNFSYNTAISGNSLNGDYLSYELANEEAFLNLQLLALADTGFGDLETLLFSGFNEGLLPFKPRILDIGCATGSLLEKLKKAGWDVTGVEISVPQAEYGRQKRGLDVRTLPLEENHFPLGHFNVVLASHLIEHLNDPAALIREVRRILAPEGRFFITTPNIDGFQAKLFKEKWRSAIFDHLYLFSVKTLSRLLVENGFLIEKIATWGGLASGTAPLPVKRIFDRAAKRFNFGDVMIIRAGAM